MAGHLWTSTDPRMETVSETKRPWLRLPCCMNGSGLDSSFCFQSLSFLANLFAGSSCFKYSNREVRGSNKWLSLVWQVSVAAWCRGPMARCCSAVWSVFHSLSFTWLTEDGRIWRKLLAGEWIVLRTFLLLLYPLIEIYLFLCESVFLIAFFSEYLCYWINFLCSFQHFTVSSSITTS